MSISLIKQARDDRDLTPVLRLTLMTVASYCSEKEPRAGTWVSSKVLAEVVGCTERTIRRHLAMLERMGRILIERPHPKRRGTIYVLDPTDTSDRSTDTSDRSTDTSDRSIEQAVRSSSENKKPTEPPVRKEDPMPVGELPPDDPPEPKATHRDTVALFRREAARLHAGGGDVGRINKAVSRLHKDEGLSYVQIQRLMERFFARFEQDIRAANREYPAIALFQTKAKRMMNDPDFDITTTDTSTEETEWSTAMAALRAVRTSRSRMRTTPDR